MNLEFSSPNLPDLEQIVNSLLAEGKCACHIINPHKTRILMWKEIKDSKTIYHLRIGIQKFTSQEQTDRNGEIYWRYWSWEPKKDEKQRIHSELSQRSSETNLQTDPNPITKYQQNE